jgi:hypothetical protein
VDDLAESFLDGFKAGGFEDHQVHRVSVLSQQLGSPGDNADVNMRPPCSYRFRDLDSIHPRHLEIRQHQVHSVGGLQPREACLAARRGQNRMPEPPEHPGQRVTNHGVIIDQEDLHDGGAPLDPFGPVAADQHGAPP